MTPAAPAPIKIAVVCVCCSAQASIWIAPEEIASMRFCWSPLDQAYLHTCGRCLYQRTDTISKAPRTSGPDRAERARTSGAVHRVTWRTTQ